MDYMVFRIAPGSGKTSKVGAWRGAPPKESKRFGYAFVQFVQSKDGILFGGYGYEAIELTDEDRGRGRPRSKLTEIEALFQSQEINRGTIAAATGYSPRYVASVLRGTQEFNPKFLGSVVLVWPHLAESLVKLMKEGTA